MLVLSKEDFDKAFMNAKNESIGIDSWANSKFVMQILDAVYEYLCESVPVIDTETGEIQHVII